MPFSRMNLRRTSMARRVSKYSTQNAFRVIAPYALFGVKEEQVKNQAFEYYIKRKPELLMKDLTHYLSDMVDLKTVLHECIWMLKTTTKAEGVNLYMVEQSGDKIYLAADPEVNERYRLSWSIRTGTTVAAYVAYTMIPVVEDRLRKDSRFPKGVAYNPLVGAVLCVPVIKTSQECYAVIELYKNIGQSPFSIGDQELVAMVTTWISAAIYENNHRITIQKEKELNSYLLDITRCYFNDPSLFMNTMSEMVNFSRVTLGASRARFFIFDEVTKDGGVISANLYDEREEFEFDLHTYNRLRKVYLNKDRGIVEYVARTGETLNIKDATVDPRFGRDQDQELGLVTRSVLCVPIWAADQILGVVQAENKKGGAYFNFMDEILFKTFSVYCSLAVYYSTNYSAMEKNRIQTYSYSKMLQYHLKPCCHHFEEFRNSPFPEIPADFNHFSWYIPKRLKLNMPKFVLYMFVKILGSGFLDLDSTIKFILEVEKTYNNHPFHNFEHAFNCTHSVYLILLRNPRRFTHTEKKGLLIGGFCHALDHSAFSRNFLNLIKDDRVQLYDTSVEQNHAFLITSELLNHCKIFRYVTAKQFESIRQEIKEAILGTDRHRYLKMRRDIYNEFRQKTFDWHQPIHRHYAKNIVIAAAECSFCWKRFSVAKDLLNNLFEEMYHEAELEKAKGRTPIKYLDRLDDKMVMEQLNLISIIWLSCTQLLTFLLPNTAQCYHLIFKLLNHIGRTSEQKMWVVANSVRLMYQ